MKPSPSIAGLIAFINEQPADRPITTHRSWQGCAVGDYAREVLGHEIINPDEHEGGYQLLWADPVLSALWKEAGTAEYTTAHNHDLVRTQSFTIMDFLNGAASARSALANTYGAFAKQIQDFTEHQLTNS